MIFWIGMAIACALIGIICLAIGQRTNRWRFEFAFQSAAFVAFAAVFCIVIGVFCVRDEYSRFEHEYEIQQQYIQQVENIDKNDILYIADVIEANEDLVKYQTQYNRWGNVSLIPARVMELTPLWIE